MTSLPTSKIFYSLGWNKCLLNLHQLPDSLDHFTLSKLYDIFKYTYLADRNLRLDSITEVKSLKFPNILTCLKKLNIWLYLFLSSYTANIFDISKYTYLAENNLILDTTSNDSSKNLWHLKTNLLGCKKLITRHDLCNDLW